MKNNAYKSVTKQEICISYIQTYSIQQIIHPNLNSISKLSIIHCGLVSLSGIQRFNCLTVLNVKFNNLEDPQEILKIPNKESLKQLNIQGNSIQHFSLCKFISLKKIGFDSLVILNNKCYSSWAKNKQKYPSIIQINSKLKKVENSMQKTLKRIVKNNVIEKYKIADNLQTQEQEENISSSQSQKTPVVSISSCERTPFRQISLSNANIIKSVRLQPGENHIQKTKGYQLVINPIDFGQQNEVIHLPLTQPTATFASQKQKQNMPFRGKNYNSEVNAVSQADEHFTNQDYDIQQISHITSNNLPQSFIKTRSFTTNNANNRSAFQYLQCYLTDMQDQIGINHYEINLKARAFKALKPLNMPLQRSYI